jgi:hypothetical protein
MNSQRSGRDLRSLLAYDRCMRYSWREDVSIHARGLTCGGAGTFG